MTVLTFTLTPAEVLSSNGRYDRYAKARVVKTLRQRAAMTWRMAGSPQHSRARCTLHVTYPINRPARHVDSLQPTWKALIDGLVHPLPGVRGLLADDSDRELIGPHAEATGITRGRYTFTFTFEELL